MRMTKISSPKNCARFEPPAGMVLKTGYKIGLAAQVSSNPFQDFHANRPIPGGAGILIDPTPLLNLSRDVLEWLHDWLAEQKYQSLKQQGLIIDLADIKNRFYELDALRGYAILMMVIKHSLDGWGRVLLPVLNPLLLSGWAPVKTASIMLIATFFMGSALQNSGLFEQFISNYAPVLSPQARTALAYALASIPGLWLGLMGAGVQGFLFLSGVTMALRAKRAQREQDSEKLRSDFLKQGAGLFGLGMLITLASLWLVPWSPIYFGTLHLLGLATLLALPFLDMPVWSVAASGLGISAAGALFTPGMMAALPWWLWLGILPLRIVSADYTPLIPFFGSLLLGLAVGRTLYQDGSTRKYNLPDLSNQPVIRELSALGRNSLVFYLAQEPINLAGLALAA